MTQGYGRFLLIAIAVCAAYAGTLGNGFTYDDRGLILDDRRIADRDWGAIIAQSYWADSGDGLYRPLTTASFALNWPLSGGRAWGYHLVNILLHMLAASLLVHVVGLLISPRVAIITGLVFALQPGPSEAVFSIVGRAEILACCMGLGAISCWVKAQQVRDRIWRFNVFFCLVGAILAKENGMAFAAGLFLWELCRERRIQALGGIAIAAIGAGVVIKWLAIGMLTPEGIGYLDNPLAYGSAWKRSLHGFALLVLGLLKLVFPYPLVADYSPQHIPLYENWWDWGLVWPVLLVLHLGVCAWVLLGRRADWGLWLGVGGGALLATSNILVASGTLFAERLLYIPAMGLSVGWAWCWGRVDKRWRIFGLGFWGGGALLILLARGADWQSDKALFASVAEKHPRSARGHYGLGLAMQREGDLQGALAAYQRAIALYPRYFEAEYNRAAALVELKQLAAAATAYRRVVALRPEHYNARYALALLELEVGYPERAEGLLRQLHREQGRRLDVLRSLVDLLLQANRGAEANALVTRQLAADPQNQQLKALLARMGAMDGH